MSPAATPPHPPVPARRAVVVGAGISGLSIAGQLAADGWAVDVLEQAPGPRPAGYMIDFFGPGFDAAESMGLLPALRRRGVLYDSLRYVDATGRTTARLSMGAFLRASRGRFFSILRPDIEDGLREWLPAAVTVHQSAPVVSVDPGSPGTGGGAPGEPAVVVLREGTRFEADLVVGADGIHSTVRREVFGRGEDTLRLLGYHVAGFIVEDPPLARDLGPVVTLTDSLIRQAGLYALPDGRVAVFAVEATDNPSVPRDQGAHLATAYADLGWRIPAVMERAGDEIYYDVVAQSSCPHWSRGRVVITGDAAYAVSLLAGQGASLALAGSLALARALRAHDGDLGAGLAAYEEQWRPVAETQQAAGRRNATFFVPRGRIGQVVRRVALRIMGLPGVGGVAARRIFASSLPSKGHTGD
ncbi:FAD-dependent monooxygenase [Arthrobacter sp.]|uniref:FAD-dependent monooxygenase n=1 Tax=Arthrobacter sp. TaxID=1667 RepID=UPI003A8D1440